SERMKKHCPFHLWFHGIFSGFEGQPKFVFLAPRAVPGCDVYGVVEEVGEGVAKFKKGDVIYSKISEGHGVKQSFTARKPNNLSSEEESFSLALLTTQQAFDIVDFQTGKSVFIIGGALTIQLEKHGSRASRIVSI
ncbi:hypothetical protein KI387_008536, partial [Taxus chinensis]